MAETSIKISLELVDKAAQKALGDFISKTGSADKGLNKLNKSGTDTFANIAIGIGKTLNVYDIFAGNLAANLVVKSFEAMTEVASTLFDTFLVKGVGAAAEAQKSLTSLNFALAQSGIYSKDVSTRFQAFAEELQGTTAFEDDLILKNAALIQSLANLDESGLKRATAAALDLSAGLAGKGLSVEAASEALGKAANGNVTALQKMGLQIQKGRDDAETFANALRAVETQFGGAARSQVQTYSGAVSQASNSFGNLTEEIGNFIVKNPAVISVINEASKIFQELTNQLQANDNLIVSLSETFVSFIRVSAFLVTMLDTTIRVFQTLFGIIEIGLAVFAPLGYAFSALTKGVKTANEEIKAFGQNMTDNLTALGSSGDGVLAKMSENMLRLGNAAEAGIGALKIGADGSVEPLNRVGGAVKSLTDETESAQKRLKSFAENLLKQSEDSQTTLDGRLQALSTSYETEKQLLQDKLAAKLILETDYLTQLKAINDQFDADVNNVETLKLEADKARLQQALDAKLISQIQFNNASAQIDANFEKDKQKKQSESIKRDGEIRRDQLAADKKLEEQKLNAVEGTFGALSSLMQTQSKELFEIGKAAAIAQATINTYEAVTKTMASVPYPFNIPLAVAQGIAGFVQVANIARMSPSFEDGGIVPGTSFTGDRVSANVNSGEMILNRRQQRSLFDMANGGGSDQMETLMQTNNQLLSVIAGAVQAGHQIVIDGKEVMNVIRGQLNAGRSFAS